MNKKIIAGVVAFVALIGILVGLFFALREKPIEGSKEITIEVINSKEESIVYKLTTNAEYLRQAMDEAEGLVYEGEEGPYGMSVYTVNGETADYNVDKSYWAFFVNGDYCPNGIDTQPVMDGDEFQIAYLSQ